MKLKISFTTLVLGALMLFSSADVSAQCAMCKRTAETNMEDNQNNVGKGLNKGILYLLSLPYLIGGIGLFAWYNEKRKKRAASQNSVNTGSIS